MDTDICENTSIAAPSSAHICNVRPLQTELVSTRHLLKCIKKRGGSASLAGLDEAEQQLPNRIGIDHEITIWCAHGHSWKTMVGYVEDWCEICKCMQHMLKFDKNITCAQTHYVYGQVKFEFYCAYGHHFIAEERNCKRGCRTCEVISIARRKHGVTAALTIDNQCVNIDQDSRLRFHCNKFRHDPNCQNAECVDIREKKIMSQRDWAENCRNFIPCNQDFYATPRQIKFGGDVLSCLKNHRWETRKEVYSTFRMMEILFDERFDDCIYGIEFTAYNSQIGLAVIHLIDKKPARYIIAARKWCQEHDVKLIVINADITQTSKIAMSIATQVHSLGFFSDKTPLIIAQEFRTKMHEMDAQNKLFKDRCCE